MVADVVERHGTPMVRDRSEQHRARLVRPPAEPFAQCRDEFLQRWWPQRLQFVVQQQRRGFDHVAGSLLRLRVLLRLKAAIALAEIVQQCDDSEAIELLGSQAGAAHRFEPLLERGNFDDAPERQRDIDAVIDERVNAGRCDTGVELAPEAMRCDVPSPHPAVCRAGP